MYTTLKMYLFLCFAYWQEHDLNIKVSQHNGPYFNPKISLNYITESNKTCIITRFKETMTMTVTTSNHQSWLR